MPGPRKRIHLIATGGTIAGVGEAGQTFAYTPALLPVQSLLEGLPDPHGLAILTQEQYASLSSDDMTQAIWLDLARHMEEMAGQGQTDGFVITHGTDTLEESAFFFHLALHTSLPVVMTGAMRPATAASPDGPLNLYQAIALAASPQALGHGVLVLFNEGIYSGRDVRKGNSFRAHAMTGGELGSLGLMRGSEPVFYHRSMKRHAPDTVFDVGNIKSLPQVAIAAFHVDSQPEILDFLASRHEGLVLAGAGDGMFSLAWERRIRGLCARDYPVVRATRVPDGAVFPNAGMPDDEIGTIAANTLSPEKARVLLMLALSQTRDIKEIQALFMEC